MPQLTIDFPANSIRNVHCATDMNLAASKHVRHQSIDKQPFGPSTNIAAVTEDLHIVRGATGTLVGLQAAICGTIPGGDRTATIELHKSTGGGAFATVLSSAIVFNSSSVIRVAQSAVISTPGLVAGDILRLVVTVGGSSGTQPQGLVVTLTLEETYS